MSWQRIAEGAIMISQASTCLEAFTTTDNRLPRIKQGSLELMESIV